MKKVRLKKVIASYLIAVSLLALNPIGASAETSKTVAKNVTDTITKDVRGEWKQNSTGWWYEEGSSWYTGWKLIDRNWYYFYSDGYMAKDTLIDGYYLNSSGAWTNSAISKEEFNKIVCDTMLQLVNEHRQLMM